VVTPPSSPCGYTDGLRRELNDFGISVEQLNLVVSVEIMGQQGPGSVEVAMWYLFIIPIYDFGMDGREKEWKRE
jgi:hypothetical protein